MSVEAFVLTALVEKGNLKPAFQAGISADDFQEYDEEWGWLERRQANQRPINRRLFKKQFPDFEWVSVKEDLPDLIEELKQERAFVEMNAALESASADLEVDNAIQKAAQLRELTTEILRVHSPSSDYLVKSDYEKHLDWMRRIRELRDQGEEIGIATNLPTLDHHWGGLIPGRVYLVLGRPGDGKSYFIAKLATEAWLQGRRVGFFSPEMNPFEHTCRVHTLASFDQRMKKACNLKASFRNRALMEGRGFNYKTYRKFCQYLDTLEGEIILFTKKYRREKLSPSFIESRIDELGLDLIIVDPIYKLKSNRQRMMKREELEDVTDALVDMGKAYDIPVVMSNQSHRQAGNRGDAPHKDNSFGADAPVQEADHEIGVKHISEEHKLILRCTKSRFGMDFRADVDFWPNIGKMEDNTPIYGDYFSTNGDSDNDEEKSQAVIREIEEAGLVNG